MKAMLLETVSWPEAAVMMALIAFVAFAFWLLVKKL